MVTLFKSLNQGKTFLSLGLVALGLLIAPNPAKAVTFIPLTSQDADTDFDDLDFNLLLDSGKFTEVFVAEGRMGNNNLASNGERELGINRDVRASVNPGQPVTQGQFVWGNGSVYDFRLEYTGSEVKYTVGNRLLTTQAFSDPVNSILFRTTAQRNGVIANNSNNQITLNDLVFNGTAIGSLSSSGTATVRDIDYLGIQGISAPFVLTGKTSISWTGTAPNLSNVAYQIKVGNYQTVPEPGMVIGTLLTVMAGARFASRNKKVAGH